MLNRYYGRLRSEDVEIKKSYQDSDGYGVTIEAGPHGWTIVKDGQMSSKDEDLPSEENFQNAYNTALNWIGTLRPYK